MKKNPPTVKEEILRLAPSIPIDEIRAALISDLDCLIPQKKKKQYTLLTEDGLQILDADGETRALPLSDVSAVRYLNGVGCVQILLEQKDGEAALLAVASAKHRNEVSDFVRAVNRALRQKERESGRGREEKNKKTRLGKKKALLRLAKMAKPEWKDLLFTVFLFLLTTGIGLIIPYINARLVDGYVRSAEPWQGLMVGFIGVILSLLIANLLRRLISLLRGYVLAVAGNRFIVRLRDTVFRKIQELSISNISKQTSGELMKRVNGDTARIKEFLINHLPGLVEQALLLIAVSLLLLLFDWRLALFILLPAPIVSFAFVSFWRLVRRLVGRVRDMNARGNAVLHDVFSGIRVVKAYGMEAREEERFIGMATKEREAQLRLEKIWAILMPALNLIMGMSEYVLLYYVGGRILDGTMTAGQMTQMSAYSGMIYAPLAMLLRAPRMFTHMMTSVSAVFDLLDEPADVCDSPSAVEIDDLKGRIELNSVSFGYDMGDEVLHNVSLTVEPGEFIGLVGKSGVGKSTLINLIMRMYDVDDGSIRIDGIDIRDIPQRLLRSRMGVVLQENFLFAGTVWQNIAYAKPNATRDEIIQAAKTAGAHEFIVRLPDGYQTYIGERGHTLSGGERQRIAIARALLHDPSILILDEATSALDTETEKLIQDALKELTKGRTTIAIAHRLSTLRNATRLVVLDAGKIAEVGTHDVLMEKGGIYYGLVMAQREMSRMDAE